MARRQAAAPAAEPAAAPVEFPVGHPVTFEFPCLTDPKGPAQPHPITVFPDWTIDTGHDVAGERVLAALGGFLSCLHVIDRVLPAARGLWAQVSRQTVPSLKLKAGSTAAAVPVSGVCRECNRLGFESITDHIRHLDSARHWALRHRADPATLNQFWHAFGEAIGGWPLGRPKWEASAVAPTNLADLWRWGLHPRLIEDAARRIGSDEALEAAVFARVFYMGIDPDWLHQFVPYGPGLVAWAAATFGPQDEADPAWRRPWLDARAGPAAILALGRSPYTPDDVRALARARRVHPGVAADILASWAKLGCCPSVRQLAELAGLPGALAQAPTAAAFKALAPALGLWADGLTKLDQALILAGAGSVKAALTAVLGGVKSLDDLIDRELGRTPDAAA